MIKGTCWKSDLDLHHEYNETESQSSTVENYGIERDPKETPVGPFMYNLFENQLYTDVEFAFKSRKKPLSAHRVVLAAKCEFFAEILFGEKANGVSGMKMRVDISKVPYAVFKDIINYFYTDDIDFPDLPTVLDIHTTANSFKIESLIDLCEQYLDELELTEDNACSTLQIANSKCADSLKERCIEYIKSHALEVISSPNFEKLSFNTVREISNLQDLNLRCESEILEAALRWINVQPEHAKVELRKSLMKCIRFLSFSPEVLHVVVKQHPELLTSAEALDTLKYLNDPTPQNMKGLPDWMNKSRRTFLLGHEEIKLHNVGKIVIPLIASSKRKNVARLTSSLQLKCIKGDHKIKGITIKLEDISNDGKEVAKVVTKARLVIEGSFNVDFFRTIRSKEAVIRFKKGISVHEGQTLRLEVQIKTCQSFSVFQYDSSKENVLTNEYFQCSVASKPKQGRHYFLHEVLFETRTQKAVTKNSKKNQRKKKNKAKENQDGKDGTDNK